MVIKNSDRRILRRSVGYMLELGNLGREILPRNMYYIVHAGVHEGDIPARHKNEKSLAEMFIVEKEEFSFCWETRFLR